MAKRKTSQQPELVRHDGGLCPHFVNTANARRRSIRSYADLLDWGQRAGALTSSDAQRLARAAEEAPAEAEAVLGRAQELRQLLERILLALLQHQGPAAADLEALSAARGEVLAAQRLGPAAAAGGWLPYWGDRGGDDLDRMLWPVVLSAVDTLSPKWYRKVRRCASEACDLFLVDRSPGRARTMCRRCGARSRSRKHYHRKVKPYRRELRSGRRMEPEERELLAELEEREMLAELEERRRVDAEKMPRPAGVRRPNRNVF